VLSAMNGYLTSDRMAIRGDRLQGLVAELKSRLQTESDQIRSRIERRLESIQDPDIARGIRGRLDQCMGAPESGGQMDELRRLDDESAAQQKKDVSTNIDQFHQAIYPDRPSQITSAALDRFKTLAHHMCDVVTGVKVDASTRSNRFARFAHLMFPQSSQTNAPAALDAVQAPGTFVMGDADGSMGRMVLHAIASGVADVPDEAMPALARVLVQEADIILDAGSLVSFQRSSEVSNDLNTVANALAVLPKPPGDHDRAACIFLGDILSDRFTNNQVATSRLIYKLKGLDPDDPAGGPRTDTGVRFIAGNHDTVPLCDQSGDPTPPVAKALASQDPNQQMAAATWGMFAATKLKAGDYQRLLKDCFQAADYSGGVLTTHNGVARAADGDYLVGVGILNAQIKTAVATSVANQSVSDCTRVQARSPRELADAINSIFRDAIDSGGLEHVVSTNFRPNDKALTREALGFAGLPDFRQVHGHDGDRNETQPGVSNLNARKPGVDFFQPTAAVIR
jgi:hypothetical protein